MSFAHGHGVEDLCAAGDRVYVRALGEGRIARAEVAEAPCLIELGLLSPDPQDMSWLLPETPGGVVSELLRDVAAGAAEVRRRAAAAADMAEHLMGLEGKAVSAGAGVRVLEGKARIRPVVDAALAECEKEFRSVEAGGVRSERELAYSLPRALELQRRGVRTRTLYNHTARHGPGLSVYLEQVTRSVEVRTLDEVPDRLHLCDQSVAFLSCNAANTVALEVRQPELVRYLAMVFDRLWRVAVPLGDALPVMSDMDGITYRERAIAALLAEGHADIEIARRIGINVRTCRHHISKLAEALGSSSRAQLGVRIAQAGLDVLPGATGVPPAGPT
ncbi:helix-turn-helix transcriptional regulator [Streptomyces luteolus]|uniref:Helix-turn-helix transcriptional regulator n=1 Tax=Streptomyces luteolus TaxID=3043615 RepID=A0ABT6SXJ4_9ACTN|nr:helix-turn-helix transcriptional regulator [Streptomyces sp. B-S-A12]MDI3420311.1 helix-turn-helix transcriptional regulator [Streptomyces sp. B-S-A12]